MEFFDDLSVPVKFLIAFVVALAVLGVGGYLMRRFGGGNLAALGPRGRQPRLAVIDAASVDGSRRLVLVRRDNVEHLLLIGGPTDVVIEPNIDRTGAAATAPAPVRDTKASPPLEAPPRQTLSLEGSVWHVEPRCPVRSARQWRGISDGRQNVWSISGTRAGPGGQMVSGAKWQVLCREIPASGFEPIVVSLRQTLRADRWARILQPRTKF
jgi:hypothetical protein